MGSSLKKLFKPNWNVTRNFHGVWFYDSDELENWLHFRSESNADFWKKIQRKYWYFKLAKIVPKRLLVRVVFKRLFNNTNAPMYWINHNIEGRIKAFYGGKEEFDKIRDDWSDYQLLCEGKTRNGAVDYTALKSTLDAEKMLLSHGYDESKSLTELTFEDLQTAAEFRGGKCLTENYERGNIYSKVEWQCREGHRFFATPYTVLKGGYWCPECCEPKPWRYGALAKNIPFYAQVYFDSHSKAEVNDVYMACEDEDDFIVAQDNVRTIEPQRRFKEAY